ncbi:MAG TPA: DUF1801 domain-containing protein [Planctomycetota bacterium]|nr:DUF1801 domain-containing protein [Planctomycetota bacterium]
MGQKDPRVDEYIARSGDFAKPILRRLRAAVHRGCPAVAEDMKWKSPFFVYKGLLCMMAAFKKHCTFGFWKHALLKRRVKELRHPGTVLMDRFVRLHSQADVPDEGALIQLVREAAALNDLGLKTVRDSSPKKERVLIVPEFFRKAVRSNRKAQAAFDTGSYTFRKEYVKWVMEAKSEETRQRRLRTALTWMAQGKNRNWKYEK